MTQQRVYDFGSLLTQSRKKTLAANVVAPGVYVGMSPTIVNATTIELSAGSYMLPHGVLIVESDPVRITVPTPGSATDYTVTADHGDVQALGGSSASYTLRTGILDRTSDPDQNSLALLWIRHTGAGPLDESMLSTPPVLRADTLSEAVERRVLFAPFADKADTVAGSNITATQKSRTIQTGSSTATLAAASAGTITVTGLATMTSSSVGRYLRLTGAANPLNNGLFRIESYVSSTSVVISDNGVAPGSDTVSWREDALHNIGLQVVNSAVTGLQTYTFRVPVPPYRPFPRRVDVYASIPALGSISLSAAPYESLDADGQVLDISPSSIAGAVDADDVRGTPAGSFVLGGYAESAPPASVGVTITVPAQTPGVFLKALVFAGD